MTYEEWEKSQSPYSVGGIQYGANSTPLPPPPSMGGFLKGPSELGGAVYDAFRRAQDFLQPRATTNRSFAPMPGGQPSFSVPPGERPALQMPNAPNLIRRLLSAGYNPPPGLRDMPRSPYAPYILENNTEMIPGTPRSNPYSTPYPRPPFMNLRHWMDTGERQPMPLDAWRPGYFPEPAHRQMPQVYDTLTSGGALA
jgi:hypothetical protein